jgi:hypothetical protein
MRRLSGDAGQVRAILNEPGMGMDLYQDSAGNKRPAANADRQAPVQA